MRYKLLLLITIANFNWLNGVAQKLFFLDDKLKPCAQSKASFAALGEQEANGLYFFKCYNSSDNSLFMLAHFADSSLTMLQGPFATFYHNTGRKSLGKYDHGKQDGTWLKWIRMASW